MMQKCQDGYYVTFSSLLSLEDYNNERESHTKWTRCPVNTLKVKALDKASPLYANTSAFAGGVTADAIEDTAENLGLAMEVDGENYPIRDTAYKSLLDRAKISGNSLAKLERKVLAKVLNSCYKLYSADALLLIRDEKVSAVHSGDMSDYSILPIPELLEALKTKLDIRFPGNNFETGYADHSFTSAEWTIPAQKEDLLGAYAKVLAAQGKGTFASRLVPGIRFITSDTGVASAKVSALLVGGQYPIHIGSCIAVDHRHGSKIADFNSALDELFAQFGDSVAKLQKLMEVTLSYPVNAMTRICKKLSLPKKAAVEAISMYEMACGSGPATAHDVFMAMQEIPFIAKSSGVPEGKMLTIEENMARALSLRWEDYDLAKAVDY